ncbi:TonB-dependent receptor [Bryobacter aggregatus]|uniref:TonB-dependent receptor n=1 Tax=Bryobacter aggregatus TaxID=360054 RepID=UPI0004E208B9|nr:TonB-dependent receptor [Bryobacter aggregatus]
MLRTAYAKLLLSLLLLTIPGRAQTGSQITGDVSDNSGASVAAAKVVATNIETQVSRETLTNDAGTYIFSLLQPGKYVLNVTKDGFKSARQENISLEVNAVLRIDVKLEVGAITDSVTVSSAPPLVESENSSLGQVVETKQIVELPLNGRNFVQLATLGPGVTGVGFGASGTIMSGTRPDDQRPASELFSNGNREGSNNFLIDGIDNNERLTVSITLRPSVEAVREFKIQTSLFSADQGRNPGATVNVVTKSGSNELHGAAYDFLRNDNLDAKNYFASPTASKPQLAQNQFGAALGGPIIKNKLFFFGNYEGYRRRQEIPFLGTVPTLAMKNGDFSAVRDIFDPFSLRATPGTSSGFSRTIYPNRTIPRSQFDPITTRLIDALPLPTSSGIVNNYTVAPKQAQDWNQADGRVDYNLSPTSFLFGRYSYQKTDTIRPATFPPAKVAGLDVPVSLSNEDTFAGTSSQKAYHTNLNYSKIITPALLMELKAGFQRFSLDFLAAGAEPGARLGEKLGVKNSNQGPRADGLPIFSPSGYFGFGHTRSLPILRRENTYQYGAGFTWTRGKHNIKWGGDIIRRQISEFQTNRGNGRFNFSNAFSNDPNNQGATGDAMASSLLGTANTIEQDFTLVFPGMRGWENSLYVQDDWKVSDRLTVNVGMRYEYFSPFREVANRLANFNTVTGRMMIAGKNTDEYLGVHPFRKGFAPRLGFAYKLRKSTVIRGGAGIFFGTQGNGGAAMRLFRQTPFGPVQTVDINTLGANPRRVVDGFDPLVVPSADSIIADPRGALISVDSHFRPSATYQYNLQVQQELKGNMVFKIGYVGNLNRFLDYTYDANQPDPGPGTVLSRRPFRNLAPNVQGITYAVADGNANYHALQSTIERRFSNGLSFLGAYTWSHSIDNVPNAFGGAANGPIPQDIRYRNVDRGNSGFDIRHRFTMSMNYELPFGKNKKFNITNRALDTIAGGWQGNLIFTKQTGLPYTPTLNSAVSNAGGSRPNLLKSPSFTSGDRAMYFDTSFNTAGATWGIPTVYTYGNAGRNILYGPGRTNIDASVFKTFSLTERFRLQFRAELFNLSNTPQFGLPNAAIGSPSAGSITSLSGNNRQVQLALRLSF